MSDDAKQEPLKDIVDVTSTSEVAGLLRQHLSDIETGHYLFEDIVDRQDHPRQFLRTKAINLKT